MIIRFIVNNLFSFGEEREFNMLPSSKTPGFSFHKYPISKKFDILKLSVLYGANGAGKSNLVNSIDYLVNLVLEEEIPTRLINDKYRFSKNLSDSNVLLGIEFFHQETPFVYAIQINEGIVLNEELLISGLGQKKDKLLFERKTNEKGKIKMKFFPEFENDKESQVLKKIIEKSLGKPDKPIFKLLSTLDNPFLSELETAFDWFENKIQIITPRSRPVALTNRIDKFPDFRKYANEIMCSFHTGISLIETEKKTLKEFFGEDNINDLDNIINRINETPDKRLGLKSRNGEEILLEKEDDKIYVKRLKLEHIGKNDMRANFYLNEESDGTKRLLEFIPAFQDLTSNDRVYIIDEMERSIHPLLIKELIKKFSEDENSKGQLIFTTHESNLLDQEIFRQDEIWFAEKDKNGCTDLYPLSEFKEHHTKNIRKGYLNGRYGGIPFLGNLKDLNWNKYASTE